MKGSPFQPPLSKLLRLLSRGRKRRAHTEREGLGVQLDQMWRSIGDAPCSAIADVDDVAQNVEDVTTTARNASGLLLE